MDMSMKHEQVTSMSNWIDRDCELLYHLRAGDLSSFNMPMAAHNHGEVCDHTQCWPKLGNCWH